MSKLLRENGLSLVLLALFLVSLVGQSVAGLAHFNEEQSEHQQPTVTYMEYITSAGFAESVFENWESEFLQMALYVVLTALLYQKGSAESRKLNEPEETDEDPRSHASDPEAPYPVRAGGLLLTLYKYSLSIALFLLFIASFVLHWISSAKENCREQTLHGQACGTTIGHLASPALWFESLQNWQSEFLSIAVVVVLSIFLRHHRSPESKPVHASHAETGR